MSMIVRVKSPVASRTSAMKRLRGFSRCSMSNAGKKVSLLKGFIPFSWKAELLEQCPGHSSGPMAVWLQCPEVTSQGFDGKSWLCHIAEWKMSQNIWLVTDAKSTIRYDTYICTYFYSFCSHGLKKASTGNICHNATSSFWDWNVSFAYQGMDAFQQHLINHPRDFKTPPRGQKQSLVGKLGPLGYIKDEPKSKFIKSDWEKRQSKMMYLSLSNTYIHIYIYIMIRYC